MKKKAPPKKFTDFKFRSLTLSEREVCTNQAMSMTAFFTQVLIWVRYGLTELKEVPITKKNFDEEVNKLDVDEITDVSFAIREVTQNPSKKKSS